MHVDLFDFVLTPDRIAQRPASPRDSARLLHVMSDGFYDYTIRDLPARLESGDVLVFNDTRVIPARLYGRRDQVDVEVLIHREETPGTWLAMARPAKRLRVGDTVKFADDFEADVLGRTEDGSVRLRFDSSADDFSAKIEAHGHMPLPPYIGRQDDPGDQNDYQTIYAKKDGAVAAPTAGLHFTPQMFDALSEHDIQCVFLTLHVGLGTFQPVKVEDTKDHIMHREWGEVTAQSATTLNAARNQGRRIVAVGTTSLRLLESAADGNGTMRPFSEETDLFIVPGYRFKIVDRLMTNFHLPRSTLFMLVCAFAGQERMQAAYTHAMSRGYRFYSYGDACLLERGGDA